MKILCIGTTPAAQRVMIFPNLTLNAVNRAVTTLDGAAGKSVNVAKVLKALGAEPMATGFVGGERGRFLEVTLAAKGVATAFVAVSAPTRQCVTVIDRQAGAQTELVEESRAVEPADFERLMAVIRRRIPECKAVVMSGTIAGGCPKNLYQICAQLANDAGALSVVDAQGAPLLEAIRAAPSLVKPNRSELEATLGRQLRTEADVMSAMRELCGRGARRVVVTAGAAPALAFDGKQFWRIAPPAVAVVNPIGGGDAFTAGLVWRLAGGEDLGEALRWAAAAGAANALNAMPGDVDRGQIEALARQLIATRVGG